MGPQRRRLAQIRRDDLGGGLALGNYRMNTGSGSRWRPGPQRHHNRKLDAREQLADLGQRLREPHPEACRDLRPADPRRWRRGERPSCCASPIPLTAASYRLGFRRDHQELPRHGRECRRRQRPVPRRHTVDGYNEPQRPNQCRHSPSSAPRQQRQAPTRPHHDQGWHGRRHRSKPPSIGRDEPRRAPPRQMDRRSRHREDLAGPANSLNKSPPLDHSTTAHGKRC